MSGHGIPSNYAGATRLDSDANAVLALTRAMWFGLSSTQRRALVDAPVVDGGRWLLLSTRVATRVALAERGLVQAGPCLAFTLTGLGIMVREAGVYTREHPD